MSYDDNERRPKWDRPEIDEWDDDDDDIERVVTTCTPVLSCWPRQQCSPLFCWPRQQCSPRFCWPRQCWPRQQCSPRFCWPRPCSPNQCSPRR